jgi:hypothetical protein
MLPVVVILDHRTAVNFVITADQMQNTFLVIKRMCGINNNFSSTTTGGTTSSSATGIATVNSSTGN